MKPEVVDWCNIVVIVFAVYVGPLFHWRHYSSSQRPPAERLVVTLRYLATGNSQARLHCQ